MEIKVLGSGCANCKRLLQMVKKVVEEEKVEAEIIYVTDMMQIVEAGLMRTPGLIVDGKIVAFGRIPSFDEIKGWLVK